MGRLGTGGVTGQHDDLGGAQVRCGTGDPLPVRVEDDGGVGAGELLDEPRSPGAGDDTDAGLPRAHGQLRGLRRCGTGRGRLGGVHAHRLRLALGSARCQALEGDHVARGVRVERPPRGRRLVRGAHQGGGVEVVDADLAGTARVRQSGTRSVGVDVDLVEAHSQGVRGADDAHRVADALQVPTQLTSLDCSRLQQIHHLELAGGHAQGLGTNAVRHPTCGQVGEHLAGDGGVGGVLVGVLVPLTQLRGLSRPGTRVLHRVNGVRQTGQQQHEGRSPGIHRAVPEARGLHNGLLSAEGGSSADEAQARGRGRRRLLQGGAGRCGRVPGDRQQGPRDRTGDRGPGGVRHGLVDVHELDGAQTGRIRSLGTDVGEGGQGLGDQKTRVPAGSPDGAVSCGAGHLGGVSGPPQSVEGVGGRAQGEQDVGSGIRVRHREDIEDIHQVPGLVGNDLRQRDPAAYCGPLQHMGP